ncbi:MAG: CotH kinase family protein [Planctomycetota bacterium]|nr:CotH kinase family protein [Planctomycetota bacterium]
MQRLFPLLLIAVTVGCGSRQETPATNQPTQENEKSVVDTGDSSDVSSNGKLLLNELLASNRANRRDDTGATSDWVEVHNAGTNTLRLDGYHLTDDLQVPDKWAFPQARMPAGGFHLVWMSGLDRTALDPKVLATSTAAIPFQRTLIEEGSKWKYLADSSKGQPAEQDQNSPAGWTTVDFDDSGFAVGPAGFGYGDEDDATVLPKGTTAVLLRREFTLDNPLYSESLILQVDYDDGFAAYLNGTRVAAANCPRGEPRLNMLAGGNHEAGNAERFDLSAHVDLLRRGKNVLAIAGFNNSATSSDMSLNASLGTVAAACHASFALKKKGGTLHLVAPDGTVADEIQYPSQQSDQALGRIDSQDPGAGWGYFLTPTPGSANTGPTQGAPIKSRISFFPEPGAYAEGVEVQISQESWEATDIRFTLDGSEPTGTSPLYEQPVAVTNTSLLRAASFVGEERASPIASATYLAGRIPSLPVMSISMKPEEFVEVHMRSTATGHESERAAFLELFTPEGERAVATKFGFRLHGGAGRRGPLQKKKSYRTYFRKSYGDGRVDYPVIPTAKVENFDKLVLRSNSNDRAPHGSNIRDQVVRDVHRDMGALAADGWWYVLLINSKSRGIYNVTERMDEEFFTSHLGPGEYDVIKTGETLLSGTKKGWNELRQFLRSTSFSDDANFKELSQRVDVKDFTSYVIVNLCLQNFDWPGNNWYGARRVPDGKWIFLCWDSEWGLGYRHSGVDAHLYGTHTDPYGFMDSGGGANYGLISTLFRAMLENPGYRQYYQQQVREHLKGALTTENIMRHVHRHRDAIATEMKHEFETRNYNLEQWNQQLAEIERFANYAPKTFLAHTEEYFSSRSTPSDNDRVALTEAADGSRQIVYRTEKGQLHELICPADASTVTSTMISLPSTAPPAAGHPSAYTLAAGERHLLYRGDDDHLHDLLLPAAGAKDAAWQHTNLTELLAQPVARCDPSVTVVDGVPHIVYVDQDSMIHELWYDEAWHHHPLPFIPRPASDVVITSTPGALHVNYRTIFGVPCEQTLSREAAANGQRSWSHRIYHRLPAKGQPVGVNVGGRRRLIYQVAEKWPIHEPFVFRYHARLDPDYREYDEGRNRLVQVWRAGKRYHEIETIGETLPSVVGNLVLVQDGERNQYYLAYRNSDGHLLEATFQEGSWKVSNLTELAGAPPVTSNPTGMVLKFNGSRYYVYRGQDGHLHELYFDRSWNHRLLGPGGN